MTMARGLPDNLSNIRPRYGGALDAEGNAVAVANDTITPVTISGTGMIYGGILWLDYTSTQKDSEVRMVIDGNIMFSHPFLTLNTLGIVNARSYLVSLLKFDDTNYIYCVGFSYGITFEESLNIQFLEEHSTTPTVNWSLIYALV